MSTPHEREVAAAEVAVATLFEIGVSGFLPRTDPSIKFPCCACLRLDEWTEAECRDKCLHFPG